FAPWPQPAAADLPGRIADQEFWQIVSSFSEPSGFFRSDNFLSNETGFQRVIPELIQRFPPGGVYLGAGPEQNFTYIAALKPRIAFIVDIRRQNMVEHLMYKALFEQSADRADFLSRLFARKRPSGLDANSTASQLFGAFAAAMPNHAMYKENVAQVRDWLTKRHGFALSA